MSRERMSRPSSSDPQICNSDGGASRLARLMCAGSAGAIQGAKTAQMTKNVTNTAPIAASGLLRARRGSEMAFVEMRFTYLLSFRAQQDDRGAIILRSRETLRLRSGQALLYCRRQQKAGSSTALRPPQADDGTSL